MPNFPIKKTPIRLAMLGMTEGNGHPYSWSMIINGRYDSDALAKCPYPAIRNYMAKQPADTLGIDGAEVTHVWTDDPADAQQVAKVAMIDNIAAKAEDVIGHVDAVLVATDKGEEHVARCRAFIDAGIPVFVDKPLCNNRHDLAVFSDWADQGKPFISSSAMRFAKEFAPYHRATHELGRLRYVNFTMAKSWETYGIHALEAVYPIVGPGFISVQNTGDADRNIVHLHHRDGVDINQSEYLRLGGWCRDDDIGGNPRRRAIENGRQLRRVQSTIDVLCGLSAHRHAPSSMVRNQRAYAAGNCGHPKPRSGR